MKPLTKAEEQVMKALWKIERGFLKDIIDEMSEPKPHSNTVATILKILGEKGFVGTETFGRNNQYHALIQKADYSRSSINNLVEGYFEGSFTNVVSFMVEKKGLDVKDLELLLKELKKAQK
ncbi:BlaI/MecI/CopY family transcriptional regulator [Segetibacter sp. 3557_3]|uniref:BlaI/MecI/CopY family transcriptional regulator n=1 Tax=Segetibacter sp. 3557_3 TaxID=2547429 RepID=UPI0010591D96|nr:BlaI/MecI/CopY family transcriptional regulator [Segetibacter sp. 3557_3]TDH18304.1 BlaI/MecI/CopY family transcriptional regulator [Segetibacter sp. 3557_3]